MDKRKREEYEYCLVLRVHAEEESGDNSEEDPPVPIPNTEVKLLNVDDTWRETARESRKLPEPRNRRDSVSRFIFLNSSVGRACGC